MQRIQFGFAPANLGAAAQYLLKVGATPAVGKAPAEVEAMIVDHAIKRFQQLYRNEPAVTHVINVGILQSGIVWKGLSCIFNAVGSSSNPYVEADIDTPVTRLATAERIEVDFHIYATGPLA